MKLLTLIKTDNPPHTLLPLAFWDGPHSVCGVCFSLNKSTSYLSLCLPLNSFCDETSRTWASLSPETRCVISIKRLWVQVPILLLGQVRVPAHGFISQSEVHGFSVIWAIVIRRTFINEAPLKEEGESLGFYGGKWRGKLEGSLIWRVEAVGSLNTWQQGSPLWFILSQNTIKRRNFQKRVGGQGSDKVQHCQVLGSSGWRQVFQGQKWLALDKLE